MRGPVALASLFLLSALATLGAAADTGSEIVVDAHIEEYHDGAVLPHDAAMQGVMTIMNTGSSTVTYTISDTCPVSASIALPSGQILWSSDQRHLCGDGSRDLILNPGESIALHSAIISLDELDIIPMGDIHIILTLSRSELSDHVVMKYAPEVRLDGLGLIVESFAEDEIVAGSSIEFNLMMQADDVYIWNQYQGDCHVLTTVIPDQGLPMTEFTDIDCVPGEDAAMHDLLRHVGWLSVSTTLPNGDILAEGNLRVLIEAGTLREEFRFEITPSLNTGVEYLEISIEDEKILLTNNAPFGQSIGDDETPCALMLDRIDRTGSTILSTTSCISETIFINRSSTIDLGPIPIIEDTCLDDADALRLTLLGTTLDVMLKIPDESRCVTSQMNNEEVAESVLSIDRLVDSTLNSDGTSIQWVLQWSDARGQCDIRIRTYGAHASAFGSTSMASCDDAFYSDGVWRLSGEHPTRIVNPLASAKIHLILTEIGEGTIHQTYLKHTPLVIAEVLVDSTADDSAHGAEMIATGSWQWRTTTDEGCWFFEEHPSWVLIGTTVEDWEPKPDQIGTYTFVVTNNLHDHCSGMGVNVIDVRSEDLILQSTFASSEDMDEEGGLPLPITTETIAITTSFSVIAILLGYINVESIRMPLSRWGWIFAVGTVRRKPRDGAYQRGRIIGYLQANPGVHFRALLNALEMSNGHLAHHLRVLEERELIWKRRAGRRVLIYPSTIPQNLTEEELPVPVFCPDPSSTQGKILSLLVGDEYSIGRSMTQRELSVRLDASQQLVSHHLRTLQRYGLIDHDRRGVRNVYFPTAQARMLYAERQRASN